MESLLSSIFQIVSGIIGGLGVGVIIKREAIGLITRIVSGAIGGVAGGTVVASLLDGGAAIFDPASGVALGGLLTNVAGGVCGGAILTTAVNAIMKAMDRG